MTKDAGGTKSPFFESVLLDALENAQPDELHEILGEDYVEDADATAMAERITGRLTSERPELAAVFAPNVRMFPLSRVGKFFGPMKTSYIVDVVRPQSDAEVSRAFPQKNAHAPPGNEQLEVFSRSSDESVRREVQRVLSLDKFLANLIRDYRRWATRRYFTLSLLVFVLFLALAALSSGLSLSQLSQEAPLFDLWHSLLRSVTSGYLLDLNIILVFGFCVGFIRAWAFISWVDNAESRVANMQSAMFDACEQSTRRLRKIRGQNAESEWPERSRAWTTLAFWLAKRAQNLDLVMTQVYWQTEQTVWKTNALFMTLRAIAIGIAILFPFLATGTTLHALFQENVIKGSALLGAFLLTAGWDSRHFAKTERTSWKKYADRIAFGAATGSPWLQAIRNLMTSRAASWLFAHDRPVGFWWQGKNRAQNRAHTN